MPQPGKPRAPGVGVVLVGRCGAAGGRAHLLDEAGVVCLGEDPWKGVREHSRNATRVLLPRPPVSPHPHGAVKGGTSNPSTDAPRWLQHFNCKLLGGLGAVGPQPSQSTQFALGKPYLHWINRGC